MLVVMTSSTQEDLTDLQSVQDLVNAPVEQEAALQRNLTRASRWAEGIIGQPLLKATYLERLPGTGSPSLLLARTPVISVTKIIWGSSSTEDGTVLGSTEYHVADAEAGVLYREAGWLWQPITANDVADFPAPRWDQPNYWVEYTAGYVYPGSSTEPRTLPDQIEQAVIEKTVALHQRRGDVASVKVGDYSVTYRSESEGGDDATELLAPYRRIV